MLASFQKNIDRLQFRNHRFLLAVSGGVDSMVLCDLFLQAGLVFAVAHCNYGLRGEDSLLDEASVDTYCQKHRITFFSKKIDMPSILGKGGNNLQQTARTLRYEWFEQLRQEHHFDKIVTAHHADDAAETLLMNLFKGTGIAGLHGIAMLRGYLFRPLVDFGKKEILTYALQAQLTWREDASNAKNDYRRNFIRNEVMPLIEKEYPALRDSLKRSIRQLADAALIYRQQIAGYRSKLMEKRGSEWYIPVLKLQQHKPVRTILFELIREFGFSPAQVDDAVHLLHAASGKFILSATHRLIRDRNFLIITTLHTEDSSHILIEESTLSERKCEILTNDFLLEIKAGNRQGGETFPSGNTTALINADHLEYPLLLRRKKTGDYFYPLGMHKKKKKLSRYLIDRKVPLHEKEKVWVLESNKKIVWVVGYHLDERFSVLATTKKVLRLKMK